MSKHSCIRPSDKDLAAASLSVIVYTAAMTMAALEGSGTKLAASTLVFGIWLYACYAIDRAEKHRRRLRDEQRRRLAETLAELERWREARESD